MKRILVSMVLGLGAVSFAVMSTATAAQQLATFRARAIYKVEGLQCAGCTARVEEAVRKLPGVKEVTSDAAKNTVTVIFEAAQNKAETIRDVITKAGFVKVQTVEYIVFQKGNGSR